MGFLNFKFPPSSALCAIPAQLWLGADGSRAFFTLPVTALFDTAQIFLLLFFVTSARSKDLMEIPLLNSLKGREAQTPEPQKKPQKSPR